MENKFTIFSLFPVLFLCGYVNEILAFEPFVFDKKTKKEEFGIDFDL